MLTRLRCFYGTMCVSFACMGNASRGSDLLVFSRLTCVECAASQRIPRAAVQADTHKDEQCTSVLRVRGVGWELGVRWLRMTLPVSYRTVSLWSLTFACVVWNVDGQLCKHPCRVWAPSFKALTAPLRRYTWVTGGNVGRHVCECADEASSSLSLSHAYSSLPRMLLSRFLSGALHACVCLCWQGLPHDLDFGQTLLTRLLKHSIVSTPILLLAHVSPTAATLEEVTGCLCAVCRAGCSPIAHACVCFGVWD